MATKRTPKPEPDREVGIPEETGPVRQEPVPIPPPALPDPPLRAPAPGHTAMEPLPLGPPYLHRVLVDGDVEALRAIATAAHEVVAGGGLSTNDPKIARLHTALTSALYGD